MTPEAVNYIRRLVLASPEFTKDITVFNVERVPGSIESMCLVLDMDDETTIRLDIQRYRTED